ncbi:hypothetical protein HF563_19435 [Acidithiobacillus ferridurans]|nr:hypothetical protein [Acidithiobacillus ferridurans]
MALRDLYRKYLPDPYPALEREAIEREEDMPPDRGWDDIPGFENVVPISLEAYRAILFRIHGWRYPE